MAELVYQKFRSIPMMQGLVEYISDLIGDDLGKLDDGVTPAVYLGYQNEPKAGYPRVYLTFQGTTDATSHIFERGIISVEDPDNPPTMIDIPYSTQYLNFQVSLVVDSGAFKHVLRKNRLSSDDLCREIRKSFNREGQLKKLHELTNSTLQPVSPTTPQVDIDGTRYHDSSLMTLSFSTTDTDYDFETGCFDEISWEGKLFRISEEDPNPIDVVGSVSSL